MRSAGHQARVVARGIGNADLIVELGPVSFCSVDGDLERVIRGVGRDDVLHVHAEPGPAAGLAYQCRACRPDLPIVLDVHDSEIGRGRRAYDAEAKDVRAADAIIVPSAVYAMRYGAGATVVPSACIYPPIEDAQAFGPPRLGGICYEGGIDVGGWRDYRELFAELCDLGVPVYCYAPNAHDLMVQYHQTGAVMQMRPYRGLLVELTRHDWALVCPPGDASPEWDSAMPNKFFECMASGLPVLTYGCREVAKLVGDGDLGFCFDSRKKMLEVVRCLIGSDGVMAAPGPAMRARCREWSRKHGQMAAYVPHLLAAYGRAKEARRVKRGVSEVPREICGGDNRGAPTFHLPPAGVPSVPVPVVNG